MQEHHGWAALRAAGARVDPVEPYAAEPAHAAHRRPEPLGAAGESGVTQGEAAEGRRGHGRRDEGTQNRAGRAGG